MEYLQKLVELLLECRISDPPLTVEAGGIGKRVEFNPLSHEAFDGFVRAK